LDSHFSMTMLLLEPSAVALRRMTSELASDSCAAWPPRVSGEAGGRSEATRSAEHPHALGEYLHRFFTVFFKGRWEQLPAEMAPVDVRPLEAITATAGRWVINARFCWDAVAKMLVDSQRESSLQGEGIAKLVVDVINPGETSVAKPLADAISRVRRRRCSRCQSHDREGRQDPLDQKWLCRYCWEATLLEGCLQEQRGYSCPMPLTDAEQLTMDLGPFYLGMVMYTGKQRWAWSAQGSRSSWIEFRPKGVLWTKEFGVGFWERVTGKSESQQQPCLAVHVKDEWRNGDCIEVRHVLQLRHSHDGTQQLEEVKRETSKPLGFCSSNHAERRTRCWPFLQQSSGRNPAPPRALESQQPTSNDAAAASGTSASVPAVAPPSRPPPSRPPPSILPAPNATPAVASSAPAASSSEPPGSTSQDATTGGENALGSRGRLSYLLATSAASSSSTAAPIKTQNASIDPWAAKGADPWAAVGADPWSAAGANPLSSAASMPQPAARPTRSVPVAGASAKITNETMPTCSEMSGATDTLVCPKVAGSHEAETFCSVSTATLEPAAAQVISDPVPAAAAEAAKVPVKSSLAYLLAPSSI